MIKWVRIKNFKFFEEVKLPLKNVVLLAGPNNSGKSTVLQAIAAWNLAAKKWVAERGSASKARVRVGVQLTRQEFSSLPLREMNLMWNMTNTSLKQTAGAPRFIEIEVAFEDEQKHELTAGIRLQYAGREMVYIRPVKLDDRDIENMVKVAESLSIVHVPPFSGLETEESRHDIGFQNVLIGQGRPGEILRNLLLEIWSKADKDDWNRLCEHIANLFGYKLLEPRYVPARQAYIICEYLPGLPDRGRGGLPSLDIANAGSGFHQVLLLLSFFYARPASVLLLDEPDAHLHFVLQSEIFDLLERIAMERGCQLIVATHSEALLNDHPENIVSFLGNVPALLFSTTERDRLREALKRLNSVDILKARQVGSVLYLENWSDYKILREWAKIREHESFDFLSKPYMHPLGGNSLREAREHFFALKAAVHGIKGLCILDGDNKDMLDSEMTKQGLQVLRWKRYEIENYLLNPEVIKRYVGLQSLFSQLVDTEFYKLVPHGTELFSDHPSLSSFKASDRFLIPLLEQTRPTSRADLHLLASCMTKEEIHPEVIEKLDAIAALKNNI